MADWFSQNAPKPTTGGDWFSQNAPKVPSATDDANDALKGTGITVKGPQGPKPPLELREPDDSPTGFGMSTRNPRTGQQITEKSAAARVPIIDAPTSGAQDIYNGAATMTDPSMERKAHGLHQVIGGVAQMATPLAAPAALAAPIPAAVGLGTGMLAQKGVTAGAEMVGVPQGYSELAGDVAGVAAGAKAAQMVPGSVDALKKSAADNYRSVLLPSSKKLVPKAEETAAMMAEKKPIALTRNSLLEKVKANKAEAGPPAGAAYDTVPPVPEQAQAGIFKTLDDLEARHVNVKGSNVQVNPSLKTAIDGLRQNLTEMKDSLGNIPAATLDDFRDKLYRGVVDATGNVRQNAPATAKAIEKSTASAIRTVLDSHAPDSKVLNDNYKLWANAENFLEDARRREIASKSGIVTGSSQGFGALMQRMLPRPVREIPRNIAGMFDSVAWNTVAGATKQRLAEAIAKQNWGIAKDVISEAGATGSAVAERAPRSPKPMPPTDTSPRLLEAGPPPPRYARGGVVGGPPRPKNQQVRTSRRGVHYGPPAALREMQQQGPPQPR